MNEPTELLPCPFCGAAAHFEMDEGRWEWVECESCGMQGNRSASLMEDCKPKLVEAWNRRTPTPAGVEPVEKFDNPLVQAVYAILCNDTDWPPKETPQQHWEGWIARRIADQVLAMGREPLTKAQRTRLFRNRDMAGIKAQLAEAEWHRIVQYIEVVHHIKQGGQHD